MTTPTKKQRDFWRKLHARWLSPFRHNVLCAPNGDGCVCNARAISNNRASALASAVLPLIDALDEAEQQPSPIVVLTTKYTVALVQRNRARTERDEARALLERARRALLSLDAHENDAEWVTLCDITAHLDPRP